MSFGGLFLSNEEKNSITATLYNLVKNERHESPTCAREKWKLFFRGLMTTNQRLSDLYFISDHRPILVKMCSFLQRQADSSLFDSDQYYTDTNEIELELAHYGVNHLLGRY